MCSVHSPYLEQLGFYLVGYGCTTCIGNSGPLSDHIVEAIREGNLVVASVLSGNRNFEGRINPHTRANYLASPILVAARPDRGELRRAEAFGSGAGDTSLLGRILATFGGALMAASALRRLLPGVS